MRIATTFTWRYAWREGVNDREIHRGEQFLHVYPNDLLSDIPRRLKDQRLLVVGPPTGLAAALDGAKARFDRVEDASRLAAAAKVQLILVAPMRRRFTVHAGALAAQADAGAGVFIFAIQAPALLGYA